MDLNSPNFLKDRLRQQAQTEGIPLTPDEEMFVELATSGRMQEANQVIQNIKQKESIQQFGQKLVTLLSHAYQQDIKTDPQANIRYKTAMQSLAGGHSIFRFVLPLILEHDAENDMMAGAPRSIPGPVPPGAEAYIPANPNEGLPPVYDPRTREIAAIKPEAFSWKPFMLLLLFVIAGLLLWLIITRSR